jgi:GxxExxY protein
MDKNFNHRAHKEGTENTKLIVDENELTRIIIGCAIEVHKSLGPGLLESSYKECLCYLLTRKGLTVEKEKPIPLTFYDVHLDCGYRLDIIVNNTVIIEVKSIEAFHDIHIAQILTYLKLTKKHIGVLLNFNVAMMKDGIKRVINGYKPL